MAEELLRRFDAVSRASPVLLGEEVHGEVDAAQLAPGNRQVARLLGARRQQDGVEPASKLGYGEIDADLDAGLEEDPLLPHLLDAPVHDPLLQLEIRDPVAEQPAHAIRLLEDGHRVAGTGQLLGRGETRGAGADDRHRAAGPSLRLDGTHPSLVEAVPDDLPLDLLDRHRRVVDPEHAGRLARRRADQTGELREVVGGVQADERVLPLVPVHQIVPVRDHVPERTAAVAEGNAAVHAAGRLRLRPVRIEICLDLLPVVDPFLDRTHRRRLAPELHEARHLTHCRSPLSRDLPAPACSRAETP